MRVPGQSNRRPSEGLQEWMAFALCRLEGHDISRFFSETGRSAEDQAVTMEAKSVCLRCSVRSDCLDYALRMNEFGVWGATTRDERLFFQAHGRLPTPRPLRRRR